MLTIHGRSFKNSIISITKPQFVSPYLKGIENYLNSLHKRCHLILMCAKLGNIIMLLSKAKEGRFFPGTITKAVYIKMILFFPSNRTYFRNRCFFLQLYTETFSTSATIKILGLAQAFVYREHTPLTYCR